MVAMNDFFFFFFIFMCLAIFLTLKFNKFLMFLLGVEIAYMNLMMFILFYFWAFSKIDYMNVFMLLSIIICEAVMGLMLLLMLGRNWSNDVVSSMNLTLIYK